MSFLALRGSYPTNPHNPAVQDHHLLLSCSAVTDTIVLFDYGSGQTPYQAYNTGYDASDGRSVLGSIRRKGNDFPVKKRLELAFLVSRLMIETFESMLEAQRLDQIVTVVDAWNTPAVTRQMWLDVGEKYRSQMTPNLHLLQFTAWEI